MGEGRELSAFRFSPLPTIATGVWRTGALRGWLLAIWILPCWPFSVKLGVAQEYRSFRLSSPPPPRPSTTSLKNAFILGTQRWHSLAQMPPRVVTLNSTNSWLCKLDLNLGNTSWRQEGTYLGGKDLVGQASPDKNISTLRHLEKDFFFFFDVLYSVLISALFDYLGLWRVSAAKVEMINFSAIRCGSWWAKCEKRSGDMCVCAFLFLPGWKVHRRFIRLAVTG